MTALPAPAPPRAEQASAPPPGALSGADAADPLPGPLLLSQLDDGPSLAAHRARFGVCPTTSLEEIIAAATQTALRGRGGAGFPFAVKLAASGRAVGSARSWLRPRAVVVVNAAEGEPVSAKDAVLAVHAPHRVLDGAATVARALGTREIHVVAPQERPPVVAAFAHAVAERKAAGEQLSWHLHRAGSHFVAGQAQAVLELLAGRENLPATSWVPAAVRGHRGRPTVLSNAESWAQLWALLRLGVARYAEHGTAEEPGTTLLTVARVTGRLVVEVPFGTPWPRLLSARELSRPVLLGGFHGTWTPPGALVHTTVSRTALGQRGLALGAGVVVPLQAGSCPVDTTRTLVDYLASQSARRCGPCLNGLPALADAVQAVAAPDDPRVAEVARHRVEELAGLVEARGACAHPDGTVRLVRSLLLAVPDEVARHANGVCGYTAGRYAASPGAAGARAAGAGAAARAAAGRGVG